MPHLSRLTAVSAIAIALAGPAAAELTAVDLWQDMQDYAETYGMPIEAGDPVDTGSGLRIEGLVATMDADGPEGPGEVVLAAPSIEFVENADGTVSVLLPESYTAEVSFEGEEGPARILIETGFTDPELTATESESGTAYDYAVPEVVVTILEATENGEPIPLDLTMTASEVTGTYASSGEAPTRSEQVLAAASFAVVLGVEDPETGGDFDMTFDVSELAMTALSEMPSEVDMATMSSAVRGGFSMDLDLTYASSAFGFEAVEEDGRTSVQGGSESGGLAVDIGEGGLGYATHSEGTSFTVSGDAIPFPQISASIARSGFELLMPILASEEPAPFTLVTRLEELSVGEEIWGMLDPAGQLDRSPVTVVLDSSGTATLSADIMDPEAMENADPEASPILPNSADINQLRLSALGAELTGVGGFTFDSSDMESFPGMPAPTGELRLSLTGINLLLEQLVAIGIIPEDQVMMGRMMLGMFARPIGEDAYETVIEVRDGGVFANGQQLQ